MEKHPLIAEILITKDQIQQRVKELAQQITKDYQGKEPHFLHLIIFHTNENL